MIGKNMETAEIENTIRECKKEGKSEVEAFRFLCRILGAQNAYENEPEEKDNDKD